MSVMFRINLDHLSDSSFQFVKFILSLCSPLVVKSCSHTSYLSCSITVWTPSSVPGFCSKSLNHLRVSKRPPSDEEVRSQLKATSFGPRSLMLEFPCPWLHPSIPRSLPACSWRRKCTSHCSLHPKPTFSVDGPSRAPSLSVDFSLECVWNTVLHF